MQIGNGQPPRHKLVRDAEMGGNLGDGLPLGFQRRKCLVLVHVIHWQPADILYKSNAPKHGFITNVIVGLFPAAGRPFDPHGSARNSLT